MDELLSLLKAAWPFLVVLVPGVWAAFKVWRDDKKDDRKERADLIRIAQEAAAGIIDELREELNRQKAENLELRGRIEHLEGELESVRKTHIAMIADKDATITMLNGQVRQLKAMVETYERLLVRNNIPVPKQSTPYWEIEDGQLKPASEPLP